jgi:hypothetical protein
VRPADRRRHAKCWPEYRRARRPVHPPGARYRPPVSAHPGRTGRRGSIHLARPVSKRRSDPRPTMYPGMAGHHDAPILRRGHPPPTPRIPRLGLDRYLRPDGPGTRASRRRGHETRNGSAASGHHSTTRAGNDASSSCNSVLPIRDMRRSAAPCICPSEASDPSAAGPFADYEPFSTTSSSRAHHDRSEPFLERAPAGLAPPRPVT